jgi:hypothetical protein
MNPDALAGGRPVRGVAELAAPRRAVFAFDPAAIKEIRAENDRREEI